MDNDIYNSMRYELEQDYNQMVFDSRDDQPETCLVVVSKNLNEWHVIYGYDNLEDLEDSDGTEEFYAITAEFNMDSILSVASKIMERHSVN